MQNHPFFVEIVVAYCRSADENEVSTSLNTKQNPKSHLEFNFQGVFFLHIFWHACPNAKLYHIYRNNKEQNRQGW